MCKKHKEGPIDVWYDCDKCCQEADRGNVVDVPLCFLLSELADYQVACEVLEEYGKGRGCKLLDAVCSSLEVCECCKCGGFCPYLR